MLATFEECLIERISFTVPCTFSEGLYMCDKCDSVISFYKVMRRSYACLREFRR